jgi:UDP-4-amino-4,6-dideoxy-N-acetyl-beta-L-altrosamine N-acetyltransferase
MLRFTKLKESDLELVLRWRLSPEVSKFMNSDIENNLDHQRSWFSRISNDPSFKYWLIVFDNKPIGVINLMDIDLTQKRCSMGYYIGEVGSRAIGFMVPPYIYNYVFNRMKLHKMFGEALDGNDNILKMHKLHGWRHVGTYTDHVFKYEKFSNVHLLELMADQWLALQPKYGRFVADFGDSI